jgi:hypothetical protein
MKCELCGGERLATSHDAEREAKKNFIAKLTDGDLLAFYRACVVASAQNGLKNCASDDDRLTLIRDMTKGYCLHCGGAIDNDGRCTPGCP